MTRKFYKTTMTITILSDSPPPPMSIGEMADYLSIDGDGIGDKRGFVGFDDDDAMVEIDATEMARAMLSYCNEPVQIGLTNDGVEIAPCTCGHTYFEWAWPRDKPRTLVCAKCGEGQPEATPAGNTDEA